MKSTNVFIGSAVILAMLAVGTFASFESSRFKGRIIAYRPAELATEVVSHVINKEAFLFMISDGKSSSQSNVIKLIFEHAGYAQNIHDAMIEQKSFRIKVRRDPTCDENYEQFVLNSPALTLDTNIRTNDVSSANVNFIEALRPELSPTQYLKCYRLRDDGISIED